MDRPQPPPDESARAALAQAFRHADLSLDELWLRYFAVGGNLDPVDLEAYLVGLAPVPAVEHDMLALTVNERLDELRGRHEVPYSHVVRPRRPTTGPLAALVQALELGPLAPPERLAALVATAGRALGVGVVVHLVDDEQRLLRRLSPGGGAEGLPLAVDGTLPGRAFQTGRTLPSEADDQLRLWVPLLAGADRLGVLEVDVRTAADLHDPALREQCRWLAAQLGYLIAGMSRYGDDLARARGGGGRAPAAELLRGQLPPLTAATGSLVLAGAVEPGCYGGGDAFDYALSERTVSLGVFDAAGTGLRAGLGTAAALAGYRTARRAGAALADQVRAVDEVVADSSADGGPVSGVLAELDVPSGRLRYVTAGQPAPLLLRAGTVAEELGGGRRAPFGLPAGQPGVAEQVVRPGDWLVLHTDGVTGARDRSGGAFGAAGLVDFLRREAAADHPPAETVRRLAHAVRGHAGNALQDDATVLLASWRRGRSD